MRRNNQPRDRINWLTFYSGCLRLMLMDIAVTEMKKLSANMLDVLRSMASKEDGGWASVWMGCYPFRTVLALSRLDLIEPTVDGNRRLTAKGWKAVGR